MKIEWDINIFKDVKPLIEQVLPDIYRLEIPIPHSPLKATNAYVIKGSGRHLLIDTGVNTETSLSVMQAYLRELAIDLANTDILTTHMHADHAGLLPALKTETTVLYATFIDAERINGFLTAEAPFDRLIRAARRNGLTQAEAEKAMNRHPANAPRTCERLTFTHVSEETILTVGQYHFRCIETPGHTKGHVCLYEPYKKVLISGDHILGDISPNITCWDDSNPLGDFLSSLKKIAGLTVDLALPGHRRLIGDCKGRIGELLAHHQRRLEEAYKIAADGPQNGHQVASKMTWDMVYTTWDEVAPAQKFFATGEALSHLRYLVCEGLVQHAEQDGVILYWR